LNAVSAVSATDAWAVGRYVTATGVGKILVLHWNGKRWTRSPSPGIPDADLFGVSAVSASNVWAVGSSFNSSINADLTLVLHWNGARWTRVPSPNPGGGNGSDLTGVSARTRSDAWASGFYSSPVSFEVTLLLHWNGTRWTHVPSPSTGSGNNGSFLDGVSAVSAADAWAAGGSFVRAAAKTFLLRWNGTRWTRS